MAALKMAIERVQEEKRRKLQEAAQKPRLTASAALAVGDLAVAIEDYLAFKQTKNLWAAVAPPVDGPTTFSFKSKPRAGWVSKVSGLLYEIVHLAPNTKVQSTKLKQAISALLSEGKVVNNTTKSDPDYVDQVDITIRVLLGHYRQLRDDEKLRAVVMKNLAHRQQDEVTLVLQRISKSDEVFSKSDEVFSDVSSRQKRSSAHLQAAGGDGREEVQCKFSACSSLSAVFQPVRLSATPFSEEVQRLEKDLATSQDVRDLGKMFATWASSKSSPDKDIVVLDSDSEGDVTFSEAANYVPEAATKPAPKEKTAPKPKVSAPKEKAAPKPKVFKKPAAAPKSSPKVKATPAPKSSTDVQCPSPSKLASCPPFKAAVVGAPQLN